MPQNKHQTFFTIQQLDWHHRITSTRSNRRKLDGQPESGDFNKYLDYMDAQLSELLTTHGDVAGIWFDGMWDKKTADWRLEKTFTPFIKLPTWHIGGQQPTMAPFAGRTFKCLRKICPPQHHRVFHQNKKLVIPQRKLRDHNNSWNFHLKDNQHKSKKNWFNTW